MQESLCVHAFLFLCMDIFCALRIYGHVFVCMYMIYSTSLCLFLCMCECACLSAHLSHLPKWFVVWRVGGRAKDKQRRRREEKMCGPRGVTPLLLIRKHPSCFDLKHLSSININQMQFYIINMLCVMLFKLLFTGNIWGHFMRFHKTHFRDKEYHSYKSKYCFTIHENYLK